MVTRCKRCNRAVALKKTAWFSVDGVFCSRSCGVLDAVKLYTKDDVENAQLSVLQKAHRYFDDVAEEVTREDYGVKTELIRAYSQEQDITTLFEQVTEGNDIVSVECVGWYFGKSPEQGKIQAAIEAGMKAMFV